jgi:periplasmic protein TonB
VSLLVHVLLLLLIFRSPALHTDSTLVEKPQGNGDQGPAGGGGGGTRGTGGVKFVTVAPPPTPVPPTPAVVPPPVVVPPKEVVPEPVLPELELPKPTVDTKIDVKPASPIVGLGGGTGNDATSGNGPGSGGGIGTGVGTGRGSGTGPGTGGGNGGPPTCTPTEVFMPPVPVPSKVKGAKIIAEFNVDERGKVLSYKFTPTKDGGYNKSIDERLRGYRFRPASTSEGVPVRSSCQITIHLF